MTYAFTQGEIFSSFFSSSSSIPPPGLHAQNQPLGPNPSLEAQILASRPKSQCCGSSKGEGERGEGEGVGEISTYVKAKVINPFVAAALLQLHL